MNKDVIIHLGLHKTGTTYLQEMVFPYFPDTYLLTRPYTQHNFAFNKLQYADDTLYDREVVLREIRRIKENRLILSDEAFGGKPMVFSFINRSMIARRFRELFPDAKIILFIRGQKDIIVSHYNNWIQGYYKGNITIQEFLWYPSHNFTLEMYHQDKDLSGKYETLYFNNNRPYLHLDCFRYYELIRLYKELFDDVHVFLYEDFKKDQRAVISRIEEIVGEKIPSETNIQPRKRVNKSLSPRKMKMRYFKNKLKQFTSNKALLYGFSGLYGLFQNNQKMKGVDDYVNEVVRDHYCENNRLICEEFPGIGLQNYPDKYFTAGVKKKSPELVKPPVSG